MFTLSICDGHNASVSLSKNGVVKFAISEERLNRQKNYFGWPAQSIDFIVNHYVALSEIDTVVLYRDHPADYLAFLIPEHFSKNAYKWLWKKIVSRITVKFRGLVNNKFVKSKLANYYSNKLSIPREKIMFLNHHRAHAYAAFSEIDTRTNDWLHVVIDAEGDGFSTSVSKSANLDLQLLSACSRHHSLGHFYSQLTSFLGMKPNQHEFKVMGLEPYADRDSRGFLYCYNKFKNLINVSSGEIKFKISPATKKFRRYLEKEFTGQRFDNVAAATQVILEDVVIEYIKYWMAKSKIPRISLSGGVSMNVKLMQRLYELQEVKEFYVVPSSGDESCVIGCSNYSAISQGYALKKLDSLYLGVDRDLHKEVQEITKNRSDLELDFYDDIETQVATLLNKGHVVARVCGRDEFGARALGNRSILASPKDPAVIDLINRQVKNRDFWMPFTPSILDDHKNELIINPKNFDSKYMNITFNSTEFAHVQLPAALHPWDKTVRPQFVLEDQNPEYYRLLARFYEMSGCPALLNTSFNLHGDPNVSSANDALYALDHSGLRYLQIGKYLVRKKNVAN